MKLELTRLTKAFGSDAPVIRDVTFSAQMRSLALIGSSGGGKSTLLRMLGGLLTPTSGKIAINGEQLSTREAELLAYRRNLGFVFQQGSLFRHLTTLENIVLPLTAVHGWSEKEATDRAWQLLERFGLADHAGKRPAELSGGQHQRAAIARAVSPHPKLLLLDEPTSALDPEYTGEVLDVLDELQGEGIEFIIVTHEMGFARHACETTAFLHKGCITESAASAELFAHPQSTALQSFLGRLLEWNV